MPGNIIIVVHMCAQALDFPGVLHSQPAVSLAFEQVLHGSPGWQPQLCTADVSFSTDAAGKRIVLGGGGFSTVSFKGLGCTLPLLGMPRQQTVATWQEGIFHRQGDPHKRGRPVGS